MVKLVAGLTPAKINLFLRVVGRRPDGYHLLDSVFLPISLYDRIRLEMRPAADASVEIRCNWPELPTDMRNLAVRAASAFMAEFGLRSQVTIELDKNIPAGAGLGGGSSDAGAVLAMMARLARISDPPRLRKVAVAIGADVPFFLDPGPARVGGIGELIMPLDSIPDLALLILVPPIEVRTGKIFGELTREQWSGAAPPDCINDLTGSDDYGLSRLMVNDLAPVAMRYYPEIARLLDLLKGLGARAAAMSGSGGAVFGVFDDREAVTRAANEAIRHAPEARVISAQTHRENQA
jgi:4-diphosphocytidyl-2-C-methyl-D-erythritol kinase